MFAPAGGHLSDEELLKLAPMGPIDQIVTGAADKLPDVGGKYCIQTLFVGKNSTYQNMAIGFLLKLGNSAYLEHNGRVAISSKLITCLLLSIYLGGHLDLHPSRQVSCYPNVSNWNLDSTMFMPSPCGHLSSKSGCLAIFIVCKSDHLASCLCPVDQTSSISCSCRATPGSVETLWEKGGTASNRPDGRLF